MRAGGGRVEGGLRANACTQQTLCALPAPRARHARSPPTRTLTTYAVVCDVTDEQQVKNLASTVLAKYENIDVVVNNAGVMTRGLLENVPVTVRIHVLDLYARA